MALLTYLLLEPRAPTRRELADLLWSEADDPLGAVRWSLSQGAVLARADDRAGNEEPELAGARPSGPRPDPSLPGRRRSGAHAPPRGTHARGPGAGPSLDPRRDPHRPLRGRGRPRQGSSRARFAYHTGQADAGPGRTPSAFLALPHGRSHADPHGTPHCRLVQLACRQTNLGRGDERCRCTWTCTARPPREQRRRTSPTRTWPT